MANRIVQLPATLSWITPVAVPDLQRMGSDADGGYILSQSSVAASQAMLSLGVGSNWTFEQAWRDVHPQDPIHSYDGTISRERMTPEQQESYDLCFQGLTRHYLENAGSRTGSGVCGFDDMMARLARPQVFLKMDIEGGEYHIADQILQHSHSITGMVMEYHYTGKFRDRFRQQITAFSDHFHIIHVHHNNGCALCDDGLPTVLEISFLRKDLYTGPRVLRHRSYLPDLDQPNDPRRPDIELIFSEDTI